MTFTSQLSHSMKVQVQTVSTTTMLSLVLWLCMICYSAEAATWQDGSTTGYHPAGNNTAVNPHSSMATVHRCRTTAAISSDQRTTWSAGTAACGRDGTDSTERDEPCCSVSEHHATAAGFYTDLLTYCQLFLALASLVFLTFLVYLGIAKNFKPDVFYWMSNNAE